MEFVEGVLWGAYFFSLFFAVFWLQTFLWEWKKKEKKKLKKFSLVSVVVPAYNEEKTIKPTIKSVLNLDYPRDKLEIIVVNDGSKDGTRAKVEEVREKYGGYCIKLINQGNKGKGAALNRGLREAKGEYFVCLDADSLVRRDALRVLLPHFKKGVGAVLPALKVEGKGSLLQRMQRYEYVVNMFYKELMGRLDCIRVTPGPFAVYRRDVLEEVGGFDERNLTEDLEMALRLQSCDYKIVQVMETEVRTIAPRSLRELYKQRNRWYKGSVLNTLNYKKMLLNKKYGDFGMMQMPTTLVSGAVVIAIVLSMVYYFLKPVMKNLYYLGLVNFDFWTFLTDININFHILDLDYSLILIGVMMAGISLFVLRKSHVILRERVFRYGLVPFVFYLVLYFILLGGVWVGIGIDLLLRKRQRW